MCSLSASAQWQGINVNPTDNTGVMAITGVASTATSATFTVNNNFPAGGGIYVTTAAIKVGSTTYSGLAGNFLVTAATPTSVTVQGVAFPVVSGAVTGGTLYLFNSDPVTYLPGKAYNGSTCNWACHSATENPVTAPGTIASGPFDPNGWVLTGHAQIIRKVAPASTYPAYDATFTGIQDYNVGLKSASGGTIATTGTSWASGNDNLNWNLGTVTGATTGYLTYVVGGWDPVAVSAPDDVFWLTTNVPATAGPGVGQSGNYSCVYCHVTGYRYDGLGPEPSVVPATGTYVKLTDAQMPRVPATMTAGTSSWGETGITCNRCHANHFCTGDATKTAADGTVITAPGADPNTGNAQCGWVDSSFDVVRPGPAYAPKNEQATKLCAECHRQYADVVGNPGYATVSPVPGTFSGKGACSDGSSATIQACMNAGNFWVFKPSISHGSSGLESYLASPHAMFVPACSINPATNTTAALCAAASGVWGIGLNAQNSTDTTVNLYGKYTSYFTDWGESLVETEGEWNSCYTNASQPVLPSYCNGNSINTDASAKVTDGPHDGTIHTINGVQVQSGTANAGCTGCHNVHYSTLNPATPAGYSMTTTDPIAGGSVPLAFAAPNGKQCIDCHANNRYAPGTVAHSMGANTPFDAVKYPASNNGCAVCHMSLANAGLGAYHYFRINPDQNYYTFSAANAYGCTGTAPNVVCTGTGTAATVTSPTTYNDGSGYLDAGGNPLAVALDVDLACGQCHGGGSKGKNAYSITSTNAPYFDRQTLSIFATGMHNTQVTKAQQVTFSQNQGTFKAGTSFAVTMKTMTTTAQICYTTDGSIPAWTDTNPYADSPSMVCGSTVNGVTVSPATAKTGTNGTAGPVSVTASTAIKAIAGGLTSAGGVMTSSAVAVANYTILAAPAVAPTISIAGTKGSNGYYPASSVVTLATSGGAIIYYTTNGQDPRISTTRTAGATLTLTPAKPAAITIKAVAKGSDGSYSPVSSTTYLVQ
jgi:hypothetical protein